MGESTKECVSCFKGCTAEEFCAENDNPDSKLCKNTKKCNGAPPGTACCKALSPSCLGCTKGCSGEEFCAENSDNKVCKKKPCPTASCEEPKDGCKYVPSDKADEDGCKKFPCGILKCKDKCPVAVCLPPKAGCKYVASDDVDENGCKKHLCGILKCEKTCKNSPKQTCRKKCPANFCPSGQCSMRSGNCCDLKCMKEYNCNTREVWTEEKKAFCKKPCPTASCEAPKDGCKYIPSDKVDENGCKKFPCGILKCENEGECAADKDCCSSEDSCIKPRGANFKQCIGKGDKPGFLKSEVFCKCQGAKPDAVCCAANTPDCVGCSNGCTGDEFCRENPDNKVCKKKPETKCNGAPPGTKCCKESTKECVSCFKGCTADEFCAENPVSKLCFACGGKCGGKCIKEGDIAGFCQDDGKTCGISKPTCKKKKCNGKSPGTVCCNEPTAECVSCKAGCTAKEFCAENDNPDSKLCKNTKKCNGAPPGTACCKALSPLCLGCTKGCSGEEFCAENSDNKVCK